MGNVVNAAFGGKPGYEEALFRQALREEIQENGGHLTHHAIKGAFVRTVEIAVVFEAEDPALSEIVALRQRIVTARAETLADAAVQLRRLVVMAEEVTWFIAA